MKLNKRKIRKEIKRLGMSQASFAKNKLSKTPQAFHSILSSDNHTIETVNVIAKALDIDPKDLLI